MKTSPSAEQRIRRALSGLGIAAASILLLAPVAGAEQPDQANAGRSETAPHGTPPAHAPAHGPEQAAERPAPENRSQTGAAASAAKGDNRSPQARTAAPERNGEGQARPDRAEAPRPNNGAAQPTSPGNSGPHKHTICHRTNSATNPYVVITVDFHAVDGHGQGNDHAGVHTGPVFEPGMKERGEKWGDIIPPFPDGSGAVNWTAEGRAIFDDGCEVPAAVGGEEVEQDEGGEGVLDDDRTNGTGTGTGVDGPRNDAVAGPTGEVLDEQVERVENVGAAVGEAVAVLGDQVTRSVAAGPGEVVAVSSPAPATIASLARTGTGIAVLAMLGLGLLAAGYVLVTSVRERVASSA